MDLAAVMQEKAIHSRRQARALEPHESVPPLPPHACSAIQDLFLSCNTVLSMPVFHSGMGPQGAGGFQPALAREEILVLPWQLFVPEPF